MKLSCSRSETTDGNSGIGGGENTSSDEQYIQSNQTEPLPLYQNLSLNETYDDNRTEGNKEKIYTRCSLNENPNNGYEGNLNWFVIV